MSATVVATSGVLLIPAGPASASTSITSVSAVIASDTTGRVYTADPSGSQIVVTDYAGGYVGVVTGISSVSDLTESADGTQIFAAAPGAHEIDAINATTLAVTHRYAVATTAGPTHLAYQSGRVWFTYGDQWSGDLGSIDPISGNATLAQFTNKVWGQALLSTNAASPGLLAVGETGISTDSMAVLNVSSGTPSTVAWYQGDYKLNNGIHDIDLIPGQSQVLVNATERQAYAAGSFTADGAYPRGALASIASDGRVLQVAAPSVGYGNGTSVRLFAPGASLPTQSRDFGTTVQQVVWTPNHTKAVAVVGASAPYSVVVYDPTAPPAVPPPVTPTAIGSVGGIVASDAVHRVFVADSTNSQIVVTDYAGTITGSVPGITGASAVTTSPTGTTVYAAAPGAHEIDSIDASTLAVTHRYIVPNITGPTHVAFQSGRIWFTYGDQWDGQLGSVDVATGTVTMAQFPNNAPGHEIYGQGLLSTNASVPGLLAIADTGLSTDSMAVLDVSSGTPSIVAWYQGDYKLNSGIHDIALVPSAQEVLVNGTARDGYANGAFTANGSYPTGQAAVIGADGRLLQTNGNTVNLFAADASTPTQSGTFPSTIQATAWTPDQTRAVVVYGQSAPYSVLVYDPTQPPTIPTPTPTPTGSPTPTTTPTLTVNRNGVTFNYGAVVTFTAHLGMTGTNRSVQISVEPAGAVPQVVASGPVDANGNLSATVRLTRNTVVRAAYSGDATDNATSAASSVHTRVSISTSLGHDYKVAPIGSTKYYWFHQNAAALLITRMPYVAGRVYRVLVQIYANGAWHTSNSFYAGLGSSGVGVVSFSPPNRSGLKVRMRSAYVTGSGDSFNASTNGAWVYLYFTR